MAKSIRYKINDYSYVHKELSWLSFNERVLQEAADSSVPAIQRVRYLGIFSSNSDEFFRVRVADVERLISYSSGAKKEEYQKLMRQIMNRVKGLQGWFDEIYRQILKELRRRRIYLVNEQQLTDQQAEFVSHYFRHKVLPELSPILLDEKSAPPFLMEGSIYFAVKIFHGKEARYAILEIPSDILPRFTIIPSRTTRRDHVLITLDNIIRFCLKEAFQGAVPIDKAEAYTIKMTRDAELELGDRISESLMQKVSASLKKRSKGEPVRFVYDEAIPDDLFEFLTKKLGLRKKDSLIAGGRYHNSKDLMGFPNLGPKYLEFKELPAVPVPELDKFASLFDCLKASDSLLYYPYNSFSYVIKFLRTAAIDPAVSTIKINLYRVANSSRVIDSLINAVENGKEVTAVVELQARFDEEANIHWAERLTDAGVNVIFGIPGLKVHSKMIMIKRLEKGVVRYYSHVGTGNFHEKTAKLYTDFSLLTFDQKIGRDIEKVFDYIQYTHRRHTHDRLMVSPYSNRGKILELIDNERDNALKGKRSGIFLKVNNLVDIEVIDHLYEASCAGVKIKLIVRGMSAIVCGIKGMSENIEAISIVDRYLEHPRVFVFENNGKLKYFISSCDLMTRNLDYRIEVSCPVLDPIMQQRVQLVLDAQWADRVKARLLDSEQTNQIRPRGNRKKIRSQEYIHKQFRRNVKSDH